MATFDIHHAASLSSLCVIDGNSTKVGELKIECLEICGDAVYAGCFNGMLLVFTSDKNREDVLLLSQNNTTNFKTPITCMRAISALNYVLTVSGEALWPIHMDSLDVAFNPKLKNVTAVALNQNPIDDDPFKVQFCIGRKRMVQVALLSETEIRIMKEISIPHTPTSLAMEGITICVAAGLDYLMIDYQTKETQRLFSREATQPVILEPANKGEFVVSGPGNLGLFVTGEGFSTKPPISWKTEVTAVALHQPYLLTLSVEGVSVYSLIDQQLKQSIAIPNLKCLVYGDGKIWASTETEIFGLVDFSWEVQLEKYLSEDRVEEALKLMSHIPAKTEFNEQQLSILKVLQQRALFIHLAREEFQEAHDLALATFDDLQEIIGLFPDLVAKNSKFSLSLKESRHLAELLPTNQELADKILCFLKQILLLQRGQQQPAVDTALLKLLISAGSDKELLDFIGSCTAEEEEMKTCLEESSNFHALALYYEARGKVLESFELWEKLILGEHQDSKFPGLELVAKKLIKNGNLQLAFRYSPVILSQDWRTGLLVFQEICRKQESIQLLQAEAIVNGLRDFPEARKEFLEFLVWEKRMTDKQVHMDLALFYMEDSDPSVSAGKNSSAKLRSLLRTSQHLDLAKLRDKMDLRNYPHEYAILCGRLGDHQTALRLFLREMKDFDAAVEYCACAGDSEAWTILVSLCTSEAKDDFLSSLIAFMLLKPHYFDAVATLQALPSTTQVATLLPFIKYSLRESLHHRRTKQIEIAMSLAHLTERRYLLAREQHRAFLLQQSSFCCVCKKQLWTDQKVAVARFPNGVVAHNHCITNRSICPVTGHVFRSESQN